MGKYWSPKKDGKLEVYKKGNKYFGKIYWGIRPSTDFNNPNPALRNRQLIGLDFLCDFIYTGNGKWSDGKIYDPDNGKTYDCTLWLTKEGNLNVRGYIGISLFGRTEVFERLNE